MRLEAGVPGGSHRRWRRFALSVAAVLVVSACGSTVQQSGTAAPGPAGAAEDEWSMGGTPVAVDGRMVETDTFGDSLGGGFTTGQPGDRSGAGPATTDSANGPAGSGPPASGPSATTQPEGMTPQAGTSGRGFTEDEISIGYATFNDANDWASAAGGAEGVDFGDMQQQAQAVIDDINARGGVAGRKLVPVFYDIKAEQLVDLQGAAQAACVRWTQDTPVFAVITTFQLGAGDETLTACLAKRQTPRADLFPLLRPVSQYARYAPYLYAPVSPTMERYVLRWLERAAALGYFDGWDTAAGGPGAADVAPVKMGILTNSQVYGADLARIFRERLARQSHPVAATYEWSGDAATGGAEMNNAVLRFRSAGVTHVVSDGTLFAFVRSAESQNYRPRYTISSVHTGRALQTSGGGAFNRQLVGALGVGQIPSLDVDQAEDPGDMSEAQTRCRQVMEAADQNVEDREAFSLMARACDGFNFLAVAIQRGGLSPEGVRRGAAAMGPMPAATTFRISFPDGRFDGAAALRDLGFIDGCDCFAYLSETSHDI